MYEKPSAPRSIGGVFDDAIRIYRGLGPSTWLLAFASELATAVPTFVWQMQLMPALAGGLQNVIALPVSRAPWLLSFIAIPIYLIFYIALIANINGVATRRVISAGSAAGLGLRRLPRAILLGVLVACIVLAGLVLLLVPGIYWAGILSLTFIVLAVEDTGVSQSMAASRRLIKGHWWRVATLTSYIFVIALVVYFATLLATGLVTLGFGLGGSATLVVSQLLTLAISTLISPLYCAVYLSMYYDLKLREERVGTLDRDAPATTQ
jgi:hypothetical protein